MVNGTNEFENQPGCFQRMSYTDRTLAFSAEPRRTLTVTLSRERSKKLSLSSRSGSSLSMYTERAKPLASTVTAEPSARTLRPGSAKSKCFGAQNRAVERLTVSPSRSSAQVK